MLQKLKDHIKEILYFRWKEKQSLGSRHKWNALETSISFSIANNIIGDYLEFGVFRGASFIHAYNYYKRSFSRYVEKNRGEASDFLSQKTRFFAFDSFEGLPPVDNSEIPLHWRGAKVMSCSEEEFIANLSKAGLDLNEVLIVGGFYEFSLNSEVIDKYDLKKAAVVNIDCDLFESTVSVLEFLTPLVTNGTVIYFDDWFYYSGNPKKGERGAFEAWLLSHPEFTATELCKY